MKCKEGILSQSKWFRLQLLSEITRFNLQLVHFTIHESDTRSAETSQPGIQGYDISQESQKKAMRIEDNNTGTQ